MNDNWEWKHLVLNGNRSCMTFHQLYHDAWPNLFHLELQSWVVEADSIQMHLHLFDEHGASPIHSEYKLFVLGVL